MIIKDMCVFALGDNKENAVKVQQGEILEFHTRDCFNNQIDSEDYVMDVLDWDHINPATGPVYVEGAEKGDVLKVEILDIKLDDMGTMCCLPENGVLGADITENQIKKVPVKDDKAIFNRFELPLNPMIGVIGVAPENESVPCGTPGRHGGNMDNTKIVGEKIKSLRETKQISIAELAERTGLAIEQIERIENNVDIPSLAPLIKIARALGVRLGTFLDDQEEVGAVITRKQDNSQTTISFSNNAMNARTHMHYQSLSKSKADRHMEPFIIDIEATDETNYEVSSHEGEEFIFVMEGTVEVAYGKKHHVIEAGDSIYYDSIVPHHVHGFQGQAAKILAVVYTPI